MGLKDCLTSHYSAPNLLAACKQLVEEAFPECATVAKARNVDALARKAGIVVKNERTELFDGKFEVDSAGRSVITLSTASGRLRSRFTLAHELGHWLLRECGASRNRGTSFRGVSVSAVADAEEEEVANLLAAEILMPVAAIAQRLQRSRIGLGFVYDLTSYFQVSTQAAIRRLADVTDTPFLFLNIVPNRFRDVQTHAEVDDAIFVWPLRPLESKRADTKFVHRYPFDVIQRKTQIRLCLDTDDKRLVAEFEVRAKRRPIPNCDLFAPISLSNYVGMGKLFPQAVRGTN